MENIVTIENLTKDYQTGFWKKKKIRALDGISLDVAGGQIFGFLGGNGAGKTTTIKILMGVLFPTSGTAKIFGKNISDFSMHHEIGYCPENPYFYDYLTPLELLKYFASLFGMEKSKQNAKAKELLSTVGLEENAWNRQLRKFSKGMLQRVGLAQSLINDPKIVFMDEPMSGLDPIGRREVRELIAGLREKGTTVFMSTHILSDVETLCDEVAILRRGRLAAKGKLNDLLAASSEKPQFEIVASGIESENISSITETFLNAEIKSSPSGTSILIEDEFAIDKVIDSIHKAGGKLVSVNSTKQSLEDLFVAETAE
ncbi:MAG: ABC transporter ATP-binding protein [Pyrinomonadaceae bacterium]